MTSHRRVLHRQTRVLLWCGFGGLLLLMAVLGISALSFLYQIQVRQEQIRRDYVERDLTLEKIRSDIYISGTWLRDYLLDDSREMAAVHKAAFLETRARIESGIAGYRRLVRPDDSAVYDQFRKESRDYLATVSAALAWTDIERKSRGPSFVEKEVLPGRMLAVDLTDRMHELTEKQLEASSREVSDLFSSFRSRLVWLLFFTAGAGIVLAGFSLWRILALEREADARFQEIVAAQNELKRLSAELLSAQESERRRISRELHDEVGQVLSAIMLGLGNLRSAIENDNAAEALVQLQLVQDMTQRNASVVRNISLLLRPTMLDDLGLVPALKWLAREVSRTGPVHVSVAVEGLLDELPEDHRTCIYRVVQEAVHNASRHSGASQARISVQQNTEDRLRVSIEDNGKGFEAFGEAGLGILGMEERVLHLGGVLDVSSRPGRGTTISFELPLPRRIQPSQTGPHAAPHTTRPLRTA